MTSSAAKLGILCHFPALEDPRQAWKVIYSLREILLLILAATVAGAEDFVGIEAIDDESNEITAIPLLLDRLMLQGALVPSMRWARKSRSHRRSSTAAATTALA